MMFCPWFWARFFKSRTRQQKAEIWYYPGMTTRLFFDIFKQRLSGTSLWIDSAETFSEAIAKARAAMKSDNVAYLIVNSETSEKTVVSADETKSAPG
jgi:hypothetical protein